VSLVLDNSATLAWIYGDETTEPIRRVFDLVADDGAVGAIAEFCRRLGSSSAWLPCESVWTPEPTERHAELLGEILKLPGVHGNLGTTLIWLRWRRSMCQSAPKFDPLAGVKVGVKGFSRREAMRAPRAPLRPSFSSARLCHVVYAGVLDVDGRRS
jgi:hypothetical protein